MSITCESIILSQVIITCGGLKSPVSIISEGLKCIYITFEGVKLCHVSITWEGQT